MCSANPNENLCYRTLFVRIYLDTDFTDITDFIRDFFRLVPKIVIGKHLATSKRAAKTQKQRNIRVNPCPEKSVGSETRTLKFSPGTSQKRKNGV